MQREDDLDLRARIVRAINFSNSHDLTTSEYAIVRALFTHASETSVGGPIVSIEQLAREASVSQASVSRFVRKAGYRSFEDLRSNYARDIARIYRSRQSVHQAAYVTADIPALADLIHQEALANLQATRQSLDLAKLVQAVRALDQARTVFICGDEHVLADFFTFQLDLMARGVGTYLFKSEEAQEVHAQFVQAGDVVLFLTVSIRFVREDQWQALRHFHDLPGVTTIVISQDNDPQLSQLCDYFFTFGREHSENEGFHSLWYLSLLMSQLLYTLDTPQEQL